MASAVSVLKSNFKISDLAKKFFFKLNLAHNDKNVGQKCFSVEFNSFRDSLAH